MKNSKRIIALFLALVVVIAGSNLFLDHKLKASETNGDTTAQEQQDTAESAQTVVEIVVPKPQESVPVAEAPIEPAKEETPAVEPVKEEVPVIEPVKEETPAAEPVKEEVPVTEPVKEEMPAAEPVMEEAPAVETITEEAPEAEPVQEEVPTVEPVKEEAPEAEPVQEEIAAEPEAENNQPEETDLPENETETPVVNEEVEKTEGEGEETETTEPEENAEETGDDENIEEPIHEEEPEKIESEKIIVANVPLKCSASTAAVGESVTVTAAIKVMNTEAAELKPFILEVTASDGRMIDREVLFCTVLDGYAADAGVRYEKHIDFVPFTGDIAAVDLIVTIRDNDEGETKLFSGAMSFTLEAAEETKPEEIPEIESETEPEEIPEAQTDSEPEEITEAEPETEPEEISEADNNSEPEEIPEAEPENKPEEMPEAEPESAPEEIPEAELESEPEEIHEAEPETEPEEITETDPEEIPEIEPTPVPVQETPKQSDEPVITAPAETEPEEEEIEIPELEDMLLFDTIEFEDDINRYIELYVWYDGYTDGKPLDFGQVLNITAVLYGFEDDTDITYRWQVSKDGENFTDIEKADKRVYSIVINEENCADFYRVVVLSEKMA